MKKKRNYGSWMTALITMIFVVVPALVLFYFLMPSWAGKEVINIGYMFLVAFGFILYSIGIGALFVWTRTLTPFGVAFLVPIALALMLIFVSDPLPIWAQMLLTLPGILTVIPTQLVIEKIYDKK